MRQIGMKLEQIIISAAFEKQNGNLAQIEINEMACFMCHI